MGAWSTSVTGNDTAQDLKSEYQAAFFCNDVETALQKLDAYVRENFDASDEEEWCNYVYSLADYMWKHGILTEEVKERAIFMIDTGFGLELWAESGEKVLNKRKKALADFRGKLLSPQPPKKKIKIDMHKNPIFETGDVVAIQLLTADKDYVENSCFSEDFFRKCHGKYVVMRKVTDEVSFISGVEPSVRDIWAVFQLYGKVFDTCPTMEDLQGVPIAETAKRLSTSQRWEEAKGTFSCESSMFYFKKRNYQIIGKDITRLPTMYYRTILIHFSFSRPWINADTDLLNAICTP